MIYNFFIFLFLISSTKIYCLNVHQIMASSLKDCKIKFLNQSWLDLDDCDRKNFDPSWTGKWKETNNLYIDYNLGDKLYVTIKFYNNLPEYPDYCSIHLMLKINEYLIDNGHDYIYYCTNCDCTASLGEKTYCHKYGDLRFYCTPEEGKEYYFFIRINGLNELDLMGATVNNKNYYQLLGDIYYLEDNQEIMSLKFSSDSVLKVKDDQRHKVNLNELLIQYSFEGEGEFFTYDNKKLNNSGTIAEDIYFKKDINLTDGNLHRMILTVNTIAKFGLNKYNSTSNSTEFIFNYCSNSYKMDDKKNCYKCFESCITCSARGEKHFHNCYECNSDHPYYYRAGINNTKNCYSSCKNADKIRKDKDSKICINRGECPTYISSDEETCVNDCSQNSEYFFNQDGQISKTCINKCEFYISEDNTTCVTHCSYINQLTDSTTNKCVNICPSNLFYNPELKNCDDKCKGEYKYFIDYKNNTKKCVKKCNEFPYIVENEDNSECLVFNKFKVISIESYTLYLNQTDFPTYSIKKENFENLKIKVNFNQNIGKRITLIDGEYEIIPHEENSIMINIKELKEKQSFNFKDNVNDSYNFGFEVELANEKITKLNLIFIILMSIFFISFVIVLILYIIEKRKKVINLNEVNDFFG